MRHIKKQEKMAHTKWGKNTSQLKLSLKEAQTLNLLDEY